MSVPSPKRISRLVLSATALILLLAPTSTDAQVEVLEVGEETCSDCTISIKPVATLGDDGGPGLIGGVSTIAQLADGRYVLVSDGENDLFKVFAADGTYRGNIGRAGQGPGEYGYIQILRAYGSGLHVFDLRPRRHTVLSSDFTLLHTSTYQLNPNLDAEVISDSLTVMNARVYRGEQAGSILHLLGHDGQVVRSFDSPPGVGDPQHPDLDFIRYLASSSSGGVWSLQRTRYRIDEWSLEGELTRQIIRRAPWFGEPGESGRAPRDAEGRELPAALWPHCRDLREDDEGRLWVLLSVPDSRWPDGITLVPSPEGERTMIVNRRLAWDTVVEVIDIHGGTLLTSERFDEVYWQLVGKQEIVCSEPREDGSSRIHVSEVALNVPPTGMD